MSTNLTKRDARKVLEVVDKGLVAGLGVPEPGKFCVEAAICYALGYKHGDKPKCVAPVIRTYKIGLNDAQWSTNDARTKGMRRAAIAQLGSTGVDEVAWITYVSEQVIRRIVPLSLRVAAKVHPDKTHQKALRDAANKCEEEGTKEASCAASDAARAASCAASDAARATSCAASAAARAASCAARAASCAASDAARAASCAARAASCAASAASCAARAAARVASYAASAASCAARAASDAASERDKILSLAAEICVEACIRFKTQGSRWLDITE